MARLFTTRRRLIGSTGLAGLAAVLPGVGRAAADEGPWHGQPFTIALLIADALYGDLGEGFPAPADTHFRIELRNFLARLNAGMRGDLLLLMRVVQYGPPLLAGHFGWFTGMEPEQRRAYLRAWPDHWLPPLRAGGRALKMIYAPLYFSDPGTWQAMGYDGPWIGRKPVPYFPPQPIVDDEPIDRVLP